MSGWTDYGVLFPTSVVGSMPRTDFVKDLVADHSPLSAEARQTFMKAAIRYVAALQEGAGLDIISDGEWGRKSYIGVIAELASGFELSRNPRDGRPWTVVADKLAPKNPGFIAREAAFLKSVSKSMLKVTLPAPALLGERMWDPEKSKKAYSRREEFVRDCIPVLRREIELLEEEGVTIVQIDDPHLCLFVDEKVRGQYDDPEAASNFAVETVNELTEGFENMKFAVHLCRRAGARARGEERHGGDYTPILKQLNRLRADQLTMEFATPGAGKMDIFKVLREDFEIGLGCVSCEPGRVDGPDVIVERVERAMQFLDPRRITLNPDCGFAPGSAAKVSLDEVYLKLKYESEAALRLREKYS